MKLMKDTCSFVNFMMNDMREVTIKVGDTFNELMWSDRSLWKVIRIEGKKIFAKRVHTYMKDWADGTEYPMTTPDGEWMLFGDEVVITKPRKYWKMNGCRVYLSWGATTGYRDPSF